MSEGIDTETMDRLKTQFKIEFVTPLIAGDGLEKKLVEKFTNKDEMNNRAAELQSRSTTLLADILEKYHTHLKRYTELRNEFKTKVFQTQDNGKHNLIDNAIPFADGIEGDNLFKELVICCYSGMQVVNCKDNPVNALFAVFELVDTVEDEDECIERIITKIFNTYRIPPSTECRELAELYASQRDQSAAGGLGGGGGGSGMKGGRRSRGRGHKGRKGRKSRRH